jgi:hypothetical protein
MKHFKTLYNDNLATLSLRDLLVMAGHPETPAETRILASVVRSYKRMRGAFPTEQLRNDLDALYTQAYSVASDAVFAVVVLKSSYGWLAIQSKKPATQTSSQEFLGAVYEASDELSPEVAPVLKRCHQLLFMALVAAASRINAALKAAKKK